MEDPYGDNRQDWDNAANVDDDEVADEAEDSDQDNSG